MKPLLAVTLYPSRRGVLSSAGGRGFYEVEWREGGDGVRGVGPVLDQRRADREACATFGATGTDLVWDPAHWSG
jgi:hypothetical protein